MNTKAILFDFDGVIADTEPQYEIYFNALGENFGLGENFAAKVKGVTLPNILEKYFADKPELWKKIADETVIFECNMDFCFINGAKEFLEYLKKNNYKLALVTSSPQAKMDVALKKMKLENTFDAVFTATQITHGKPNPMCYLTAAANLGFSPDECVVFEDSIAGLQAGRNAGAKVVGLSTTLPAGIVKNYAGNIIPDFANLEDAIKFL